MQSPQYDPEVAETCYTYRPNRITYSLPQNTANKKDFWRVWLPYTYKDFTSRPTAVKQFSKNGALILFNNMSPVTFAGQDQLTTDGDTKLVIGDGGFHMTMGELETSAKYDLPVTVLIFNNGSLGLVESKQIKKSGTSFGVEIQSPDYVNLAQSKKINLT